jgi:hypothetical protein
MQITLVESSSIHELFLLNQPSEQVQSASTLTQSQMLTSTNRPNATLLYDPHIQSMPLASDLETPLPLTVPAQLPALSSAFFHDLLVNCRKICFASQIGMAVYLPRNPTFAPAPLSVIQTRFGITNLFPALRDFLQTIPTSQDRPCIRTLLTEDVEIPTYSEVELSESIDPDKDPFAYDFHNCLHASPTEESTVGPGCDTVIVRKH